MQLNATLQNLSLCLRYCVMLLLLVSLMHNLNKRHKAFGPHPSNIAISMQTSIAIFDK